MNNKEISDGNKNDTNLQKFWKENIIGSYGLCCNYLMAMMNESVPGSFVFEM